MDVPMFERLVISTSILYKRLWNDQSNNFAGSFSSRKKGKLTLVAEKKMRWMKSLQDRKRGRKKASDCSKQCQHESNKSKVSTGEIKVAGRMRPGAPEKRKRLHSDTEGLRLTMRMRRYSWENSSNGTHLLCFSLYLFLSILLSHSLFLSFSLSLPFFLPFWFCENCSYCTLELINCHHRSSETIFCRHFWMWDTTVWETKYLDLQSQDNKHLTCSITG